MMEWNGFLGRAAYPTDVYVEDNYLLHMQSNPKVDAHM